MVKNYFGEKNNQKKRNKMILVTGATGLVGSHLLYELAKQNKQVKALYRNESKIKQVKKVFNYYAANGNELHKNIKWAKGDILDLYSLNDAFKGVSEVYHCAAIVSFDGNDKAQIIDANVQGTENVVNLCLQYNVKKLCHVSSIASLGGAVNGELITEESGWSSTKNHSPYAISKFKSEMVVWRGIQEGLEAVIVNPSVILGPGFWDSGSGALFTRAAKGVNFYTTGATGFVDVKDVVDVMIGLMESDVTNERFIVNSENVNYKELFDLVAESMNVKKPKKQATRKMLKIISTLEYLISIVGLKKRELTSDVIRASFSKSTFSNKKTKEVLGKNFIPVSTSISDTAEKFKQELTIR